MKEIYNGKIRTIKRWEPRNIEERIQLLEDSESIKEIMHLYCISADTCNPEGMIGCFSADAITCYKVGDKAPVYNKNETYEFYKKALSIVASGSHHISNEQLLFETRDRVISFMYLYSWQRFKQFPDTIDLHRWGRYEICFVRESDGEWRIKNLQLLAAGEYNGKRIAEHYNRSWPPLSITI